MQAPHTREEELPPGYAKEMTDLYFPDVKDRAAFNEIMDRNGA
jgi:hypothetical protein